MSPIKHIKSGLEYIMRMNSLFPLYTDQSRYVNYESAVNPEYYNRTTRQTKIHDYGEPIVHRKLGLSTANEKIVYQNYIRNEFKKFNEFLDDFVCLKEKMCQNRVGIDRFRHYLFQLKSLNQMSQEKFFKAISEPEFKRILQNIIEIYDKFFDIGYCNYTDLKILRTNVQNLLEMIDYENKARLPEIIDNVIWISDAIKKYKTDCE